MLVLLNSDNCIVDINSENYIIEDSRCLSINNNEIDKIYINAIGWSFDDVIFEYDFVGLKYKVENGEVVENPNWVDYQISEA